MKLLVVVPDYPSKSSSSYQFVHERVKKYKQAFDVEVFCYNNIVTEYEHDGIKVTGGSKKELIKLISKFDTFAFHFLSLKNAAFIYKYLKDKKVFVWFHGSDCVSFKRRLSRIKYTKNILTNSYKYLTFVTYYLVRNNLIKKINKKLKKTSFVFVSNWLKEASEKDLKIKYSNYYTVPNYVDCDKFSYVEKKEENRFNVLSINNYSSNIYAGDITQDIILELSKTQYFNKFSFSIYGKGPLFKKYTEQIKDFDNVYVKETNLNHDEIKELHKKNGVFLYPKRGDSQGVSRCEAMASGLVSIASNIEAISEFSPESTTYLANNINEFINSFIDIYNNSRKYLEKSKNGRIFIEEKCSYNNTINKEIEILTK